MGINTQTYLHPFFAQLRAQMVARGQKVQPVVATTKTTGPRNPGPDVVIHITNQENSHE